MTNRCDISEIYAQGKGAQAEGGGADEREGHTEGGYHCREVNASWRRRVHFTHYLSFHVPYIYPIKNNFLKYNMKYTTEPN
jgi:hypothetical protein